MKKKFLLYAAAVVLSISAFTGCVSAPEGNGGQGAAQQGRKEGAGPVEVVIRWLKALKAEDADAYIDAYWPDAEKIIEFRGERTALLGREEILRHQKRWWDRQDTGSVAYEKPKVAEHEHPDRKIVVLTHTSHRFSDRFLLLRRDGVWKIEHHSVHETGAPKVASDFQRWADKDDSGELEDEEYKRFVRAGTTLVIGPHKNRSPLDGLLLFIENAFVNTRRVKVVERNNIESIVEEYEFQRTAMTEESTAVEIGKLANAELIVTGAVTFVGESYYLNIKLIDVESGEIAGSSLAGADGEEGFLEMCNTAVEALFPG
jgi:hypothetical protein